MLWLEIKKQLHTSLNVILLCICILLSLVMAYLPVTYERINTVIDGNVVTLSGFDALKYKEQMEEDIAGEISSKTAKKALRNYQECLKQYNVNSSYDLPEGVYGERIAPYYRVLHIIQEVYADPQTGIAPDLMELTENEMNNFESRRIERFESLMRQEKKKENVIDKAIKMYSKVDSPLVYSPYYDTNALDYESLVMFLVMICCIIIAAPVFSVDYQSRSDDILRCTKHGRMKLVLSKYVATVLISEVLYFICVSIYCFISVLFYGSDFIHSSVQTVLSVFTLESWTIGELLLYNALAGAVCLFSSVTLILCISSRIGSTSKSITIAMIVGIFPMLLDFLISSSITDWLCAIIPTGGMCLAKSFYYAIFNLSFLSCGDFAITTKSAIVLFAVIGFPIYWVLMAKGYLRHEIK